MTKLKNIEIIQGNSSKKQQEGEDEKSVCSPQESGIYITETIDTTDKVEVCNYKYHVAM